MRKVVYILSLSVVLILGVWVLGQDTCHCEFPRVETLNIVVHDFELRDQIVSLKSQGYTQFVIYAREDVKEQVFDLTATRFR